MRGWVVRTVPLIVVLVVTWVLLQGQLTIGNVLGGTVLGIALGAMFPVDRHAVRHRLHPWAFMKFVVFVLYSLVTSSWAVIKIIVRPTPTSLRAGIVRIRLETESPLTTTIVANAVTLTPGTMTITARVGPAELHVHVLGLDDHEAFRASVLDLEERTVAALTPVPPTLGGSNPPAGDVADAGAVP